MPNGEEGRTLVTAEALKIGQELKSRRRRDTRKIDQLSYELHCHKSKLYRMENGDFDLSTLILYANILKLSADETWELCRRAYPEEMSVLQPKTLSDASEPTHTVPLPRQKFGTQAHFYKNEIEKACKAYGPGTITFYHYSGAAIEELVGSLHKMGYSITIYTQDPNIPRVIGCYRQVNRIIAQRETYSENLRNSERLKIYKSPVPLTLRAANINDQHIVLGWYIYELNETLRLWGHSYDDHENAHDLYGLWLDAGDEAFNQAKEFLELYEKLLAPKLVFPINHATSDRNTNK